VHSHCRRVWHDTDPCLMTTYRQRTKDGSEDFSLLYETSTVTSVGRLSILRRLELRWLYVGQVMEGKKLQYYDNNVCLVVTTSGRWSDHQHLPVLFLRVTAELLVASYTYSLATHPAEKFMFVYLRVATSIEHYGSGDRVRRATSGTMLENHG
jgi:hypothetical protein